MKWRLKRNKNGILLQGDFSGHDADKIERLLEKYGFLGSDD